ncbi:uncharacterized protein LOC114531525 [Dendronephthya gigantea]|uniref:uncharacterized protein LOC114531525 n=1 Tax=Dendronephthya gigantea TaxID=151771 RepID=UPI00106D7758|nr:uncharacterized protein LOC114531525 [Dendronephthya gigantea]
MARLKRLITRAHFIRVFVVMFVLMCGYQLRHHIEDFVYKNYCAEPLTSTANDARNFGQCRIPKIDPFHVDVMPLIKSYGKPLQCKTKMRATLSRGKLEIFGSDVVSASYQTVHRPHNDDFRWDLGKPVTVKGKTAAISDDFIELTLKLANGDLLKEHLLQISSKAAERQPINSELNLNILIFAMDSTSHGHAQRKLPKSYAYIRDQLQGYVFTGHSAVGDGTTEQLAALLTGKGEREQPEARRGMPGAKVVDGWDWIFKKAKAHGYYTSYVEDAPSVGAFNYRLLGFKDPPTDFYPRAFLLAAKKQLDAILASNEEERQDKRRRFCYGSQKVHRYHFDIARQMYDLYRFRKKFLFHFTDITHSDFNAAEYLDEDLLDFLTEFHHKGHLRDTLLIVMGDHGWRYGDFRQTVQGKLEERLPLFTIILPTTFREKYPNLDQNLKTNTKRLTSWFDVYKTLSHVLVYPKEPDSSIHGTSLLNEVPAVRSCKDAHIPSHWCPCLQWTAVNPHHNHVQRAVLHTVKYINSINSRDPLGAWHCAPLTLGEVKHSEVETPSNEVLRFFESGKDGYEPVNGYKTGTKDQCNYQITFQTLPSNGIFEASVKYDKGEFRVEGGVSRINEYGDQPKCIARLLPHLRKYCLCK